MLALHPSLFSLTPLRVENVLVVTHLTRPKPPHPTPRICFSMLPSIYSASVLRRQLFLPSCLLALSSTISRTIHKTVAPLSPRTANVAIS